MTQSSEQLLSAVLALSESERFEIAEAIIASLPTYDESPLDESWRAEIQRRAAEIDSGKSVPSPWETVKQELWERTGG
jgi:putative addiction module component (TIGR02574 family)